MATIINTPGNSDKGDSGLSMMLGIVALIVVMVLVYLYVLPVMSATPEKAVSIDARVPAEVPANMPYTLPAQELTPRTP